MSSTTSNTDYLGVMGSAHNHRRRHSDSYFPLKRHNRRHRMRGALHPKYSYSPNPRYKRIIYRFFLESLGKLDSITRRACRFIYDRVLWNRKNYF